MVAIKEAERKRTSFSNDAPLLVQRRSAGGGERRGGGDSGQPGRDRQACGQRSIAI